MASQNGGTKGKKSLIVNAFVEMCKSFSRDLSKITTLTLPQAVATSRQDYGDTQTTSLGNLPTSTTGWNWQSCSSKPASTESLSRTFLVSAPCWCGGADTVLHWARPDPCHPTGWNFKLRLHPIFTWLTLGQGVTMYTNSRWTRPSSAALSVSALVRVSLTS